MIFRGAILVGLMALPLQAQEEDDGEMAALTGEGYRFFVPHGQAIAVCRDKIAAGE